MLALALVRLDNLQHRADVVLDVEPTKDRRFLRKITDTEPGTLIHRELGDVVSVELDLPAIGLDQACDHIEHSGLAGSVWAEQANGFATPDVKADALHHFAPDKRLLDRMHSKEFLGPDTLRRRRPGGWWRGYRGMVAATRA